MRLLRRKRRAQWPPLAQTLIEVRVGGQVMLGPMTLEALALIGKYGGGGNLLSDLYVAPGQPRLEIFLDPPTC